MSALRIIDESAVNHLIGQDGVTNSDLTVWLIIPV